ncbi:MAG: N-acetyl-gamma-glutamyl-phosphate reductase [Chloroflexota bacterium]|jgi:N-acetyl-gamma-glutamyl-phosphate reductase|nr:MAG: N-acetyl-gamma-glutamyl-phosphate reductase [SAR202 cluster bacterium]MEC7733128.1 N-acetyl-gamma-glutamyl-phosphate reductase [Chloroflexota bacterium]MED5409030.1 N-acetyl-gamma-glutamyl-phosphate reductase [Chloroflexota bacterium]MEE3346111.1 N-acetyl-gamma-glutamyl-phosphate reductase [Chloroflexota bacterium]|tara:strand:- start:41 stop:1072 length:1032 start_codon:yes stop_codon:yes gene_type:complete
MKVGIINVTGYAGAEVARILSRHEEVEITCVTGRSGAGKNLGDIFPHLSNLDMEISPDLDKSVDFVFSALPHAASAEALKEAVSSGIKGVDISADFRIRDLNTYSEWYDVEHPCPELMESSVYGLPELHRSEIKDCQIAANPGCYPTASILGLAPALEAGIIEPEVIVDAKSGVSGAGRSLSLKIHYSEVNENISAYGLDGHRHMPEISQELDLLSAQHVNLTFLPHLIPMTRGILASCYAPLKDNYIANTSDLKSAVKALYKDFYKDEKFTHVVDTPPMTKHTLGSNDCIIYPTVDIRAGRLMVVSCIDNLVKGAAGQAIQNMNIMCGMPEDSGLNQLAIYP